MPLDLDSLLDPVTCAVVTQECQGGVIGAESVLPELAEVARSSGMIEGCARVVHAARAAGVPVLHSLAVHRSDGRGGNHNARLFAAVARSPVRFLPGTPAAQVIPEIGEAESDFSVTRLHGLGPFAGTDLDALLRNLGVRTVVGVGVSVNVGMTNLIFDAVNAGYQVVVPPDAVAGVPVDYAEAVIRHTWSVVATMVPSDQVAARWERGALATGAGGPDTGREI